MIFSILRLNIQATADVARSMLIEQFITYVARKKNFRYLRFSPDSTLSELPAADSTQRLLYVHVPFCEELCPYCSFHRVVFQEGLARAYFDALRKEIAMYNRSGYAFNAVYVGGGTPTILVEELAETLQLAKQTFPIREISVETNPNHLTSRNIDALKAVGVNRLSVGIQSFDDGLLRAAERYHKYGSGEEIADRLKFTQGHFDTLNVDMIFNFPSQSMTVLEKDLSTLLDLGVDQITYYPLMPSAYAMEAMRKKLGGSVNFKREQKFFMKITEMLEHEYHPSTAWCFSKGASMIDEYVVHFAEYAGIGSGSIGYLQGTVYANTFDIGDYIEQVNRSAFPFVGKKDTSLRERLRYEFLMRLFGLQLDVSQLAAKFRTNPYKWLWPEILFFRIAGGLKKQGHLLTLTRKGRYYWVIMMREFFIGVNNFRDYCRAAVYGKS